MDSSKSIGGEFLRESLYSCTFIINVSHNFYENLFGFLQNLLGENLFENRFSDSRRISSPGADVFHKGHMIQLEQAIIHLRRTHHGRPLREVEVLFLVISYFYFSPLLVSLVVLLSELLRFPQWRLVLMEDCLHCPDPVQRQNKQNKNVFMLYFVFV